MRKNICSVLGAFLITINACHAGGIEELQRFVDKSISGKASFIQRTLQMFLRITHYLPTEYSVNRPCLE